MGVEGKRERSLSRRDFVRGAAAAAAIAAGGGSAAWAAGAREAGPAGPPKKKPPKCDGVAELFLKNGRILTLDDANTVATDVLIRGGRIAQVGKHVGGTGPCPDTIDLKGATVIPGLIDSHVHSIRAGINPGHEVRYVETATSIADLQAIISDRAKTVPAGDFLTCIGGWNRRGFAENRLPTPAELDAAAPNNPVYLSETGGGNQGVTNTAGAAFFTSHGVTVSSAGVVSSTGAAMNALVAAQTEEDKERGTAEFMDFASSLGLTMVHDMGGLPGLDAYKYSLDLWRQGTLKVRQRFFFWSGNDTGISQAQARIDNNLNQLGDDYYRPIGVGERLNTSTTSPLFVDICNYAASKGWTLTQHSLTPAEIAFHISAYQQAANAGPIGTMRWSLCHVNAINDAQIQQVKDLGIGLNIQGTQYTGGATSTGGPPFRKLLDAGIPCGGGTDATNVAALNPWLMLYYMTTGKNNAGDQLNPGQSISRVEALKMYTRGSAYLSFDDDELGTIEEGKLADLVVLSDNPLTVSDDKLRKLTSVLTIVGGEPVYGAGRYASYVG